MKKRCIIFLCCCIVVSGSAQWQSLGGGVSKAGWAGNVTEVLMRFDPDLDRLYAVGYFDRVGYANDTANMAAYFEAGQWHAMGGGFDLAVSHVHDIELINGELYACGYLRLLDDLTTVTLAKWTGSEWVGVGNFNNLVYSLVPFQGDLFAFGPFTTVDGDTMITRAKLDGGTWVDPFPGLCDNLNDCGLGIIDMTIFQGDTILSGQLGANGVGGTILRMQGDSLKVIFEGGSSRGPVIRVFSILESLYGIDAQLIAYDGNNMSTPVILGQLAPTIFPAGLDTSDGRLFIHSFQYLADPGWPTSITPRGRVAVWDGAQVCFYGDLTVPSPFESINSPFFRRPILTVHGDSVFTVCSGLGWDEGLCWLDIGSTVPDTCLSAVLGIEEIQKNELSVFPNPTTGGLTITWPQHWRTGAQVQVEVLDVRGRSVIREQVLVLGTSQNMDLAGLAKGAYIVAATFSGSIARTLIVKK